MTAILHPVTQISGAPQYTAQQIRRTVNPFIAASNYSQFDGIAGVRAGTGKILTISGNTVNIKRHAGQISPFAGYGVYHYSMDADMRIAVPSMTASYKIAMVMSDKSLGQGTGNTIAPLLMDIGTVDSAVPGLVLGTVINGVVSDTVQRVSAAQILYVSKKQQLPSSGIIEGQVADVNADGSNNGLWVYLYGQWVPEYRDVTSLFSFQNPDWWNVQYFKAYQIYNHVSATFRVTRKQSDFNSKVPWYSELFYKMDSSLAAPQEIHIPAASAATSPTSLLVQVVSNSLSLRKPVPTDVLSNGQWVEFAGGWDIN